MILAGMYLLPLLGSSALRIGNNYPAIAAAVVSAALGAVGFGIMVGSFVNSRDQGPTFGAVLVVILGILGGVMVPVYLMPDTLNTISQLSPIRWGIDAFTNIFIYDENIKSVLPNCFKLILLFLITIGLSAFGYLKRR